MLKFVGDAAQAKGLGFGGLGVLGFRAWGSHRVGGLGFRAWVLGLKLAFSGWGFGLVELLGLGSCVPRGLGSGTQASQKEKACLRVPKP